MVARNRVASSNVPDKEKLPFASAVVDIPASGPSTTSTRAPSRCLNAVSDTLPLTNPSGLEGGVGCATGCGDVVEDGDVVLLPPHADAPITSRTTHKARF